jgi:IclR family acetate operon transcriptional repressor
VSDLARASGLHKSVVARLLATMARSGFVVQDPVSRAYSVGPTAFAVGSAYQPYALLNRVARPVLERLTAGCGHASYLGAAAGDRYVFVLAVESTRSVRVAIDVGERRHYHAGAIGKALLAEMDDEEILRIVGEDPLPAMTPFTIRTRADLLAEVAQVRASGVAHNRQESIVGAGSVAVAIRTGKGRPEAGIGIVFPTHVVSEEETAALARTVAAAGEEIWRLLGQRLEAGG